MNTSFYLRQICSGPLCTTFQQTVQEDLWRGLNLSKDLQSTVPFETLIPPFQSCDLVAHSGPWGLTFSPGWLGHVSFFIKRHNYAGYPESHNFRALDFLQCFLEHSLANVGFNWNRNLWCIRGRFITDNNFLMIVTKNVALSDLLSAERWPRNKTWWKTDFVIFPDFSLHFSLDLF